MIISFEEYKKKEEDLDEYKTKILDLISEFILANENFRAMHSSKQLEGFYKAIDFYKDKQRRNDFVVKFNYDFFRTDEFYFSTREYSDLLEYMKNPDMYVDIKKFNL